MFGRIESYDPDTQTGVITAGKEVFKFDMKVWVADTLPEKDDIVRFDLRAKAVANITLAGAFIDKSNAVKRRWVAALLSFLLGWAGMSRLYLGYYQIAFVQILLTVILVSAGFLPFALLWGFLDAVLLMAGHNDKDAKGRPLK
jgi:TM2 domain-containing membrane protein YozV